MLIFSQIPLRQVPTYAATSPNNATEHFPINTATDTASLADLQNEMNANVDGNAINPNRVTEKLGLLDEPLTGISQPQYEVRKRDSFDFNWKFNLGDITSTNPTSIESPAISPDYNDSGWRTLNLPHDWSIEGGYSQDNPSGYLGGYTPSGIGWYRKTFQWSPDWQEKQVSIEFDGVYMNSDVWINGHHLGNRPYGYSSFTYDLTPYLQTGSNVIAVRVDSSKAPSGRWYTGSGIYRHTWLTVTDKVHVAHWGTYVTTPTITNDNVSVDIKTTVQNDSSATESVTLVSSVLDAQGNQVSSVESTPQKLEAGTSGEMDQITNFSKPHLWSINDPYLYSVKTYVNVNGKIVDDYKTTFGVRTIKFDPSTGFWLNGTNMKILGMCMHHDAGPVGAAVPDKEWERRLRLLKQMGVNAIRTSHNPESPEFYALADRLGLMIMDEAFDGWETPKATYDYSNYFSQLAPSGQIWGLQDLGDMVQRDRNHPSIILWSIGNEIPKKTVSTEQALLDTVHKLDPTRLVTGGYNDGANNPFRQMLDVAGYNEWGDPASKVEGDHALYPDKPMIGTEWPHTYSTRGEYRTQQRYYSSTATQTHNLTTTEIFNIPRQYESSYDNDYTMSNVDALKFLNSHPYLSGIFRWTGFDYLGEASHSKWPTRQNDKGIFDLAGFPKDVYYLYKSQWTNQPVIHILPSWTHPGMEGVTIPVWVYTNADSVELFLNGKSLGEKQMTSDMYLSWNVPYMPGVLEAVGKKKAGDGNIQTLVDTVVTAGQSTKISLHADNTNLEADSRDISDLAFEVVDSKGNFEPYATDTIHFKTFGPVNNIGMDNGDPLDLTNNKSDYRKVFNGLGMGIFQSTQESGDIEVMAGGILSSPPAKDKTTETIDVERIALRGKLKPEHLTIRYTTDGSEPSKDSPLYSEPFTLNKLTTVKVAVFANNKEVMTFADQVGPDQSAADVTAATATPGDNQVTLKWTDPTDPKDLDEVKVTDETGSLRPITVRPGKQTLTVSGLMNGNSYRFKVTTVDFVGNESAGVEVEATPEANLSARIKEAKGLKSQDYTASAWAALQAAITQAQSVSGDPTASAEAINQAGAALEAAVNNTLYLTVQDNKTTSTEGNPLNKFYYYSANDSWQSDSTHTWDNPNRSSVDYASLMFVGTQISLYASSSKNEGYLAVSIDGGPEQDVDENSSKTINGKLVYTSPDLAYGQHTIKFRCEDRPSQIPSNDSVNIDSVRIRQFDPNVQPGEVITWPTASITYGQMLTAASFSGGSVVCNGVSVPGTFTFNNLPTSLLDAGTYTYDVTFTPNDQTQYNTITGKVSVTVSKVDANITVQGYTGMFDGSAHGATGTATGVNGEDLSSLLNLGDTFTNVPGGIAHWTFAGNANYNSANSSVDIKITYRWLGIQQPINYPADTPTATNISSFNAESTIPVIFKLGDKASDAVATIQYSLVTINDKGEVEETTPVDASATGKTVFRYDATSDQYIYNLSTKGMSPGTYKLIVTLNDGNSYFVYLALK